MARPGRPEQGASLDRRSRWPPHVLSIAGFALVAAALLAAVPLLSRSLRADARRRAGNELGAIAQLKADQIVEWRRDQLRNASYAATYPSARSAIEAARAGRLTPHLATHISEVLAHLAELQGYLRIGLLGPGGVEIAGWAPPDVRDAHPSPEVLRRAIASADGAASELRLDSRDRPHLDVVVTVGPAGAATYVLFLRADAAPVFEDVLERWPVPSETAAGSLALLEGNLVRLLVPRRSVAEGFPGIERIPLSDTHRPVVRAFRGATGLIEGLDYRGDSALVASREVPGTAWRVQAKISASEVEAPLRRPLGIIFALGTALLGASGVMLALSWRQNAARIALDARLAEAQERLALAVSGTHAIWDWDLAAGALHFVPEWSLGGAPPVGAIEGPLEEVLARIAHADDAPAVRARFEAHLRGETALFESEHRVPAGPDGPEWIRVRGRVSRRAPDGRPLRFAAVVSDVTERRAMQAQLELSQRMAGLGTLAAGVAHEINNPLASVSANLDFLGRELETRLDLAGAVADARDAADRVRDVVRALRAFSSPGEGGRAAADVRTELEAAIRIARNEIRHRARLEVRIGDLPMVEAGAHELGQVFLNLLVNAAQAIPEGRADEHLISVEAARAPDGAASILVRDTGVGIPPNVLERIFEPFFTTKALGVGTGLGLAIAHRIVSDAGGRIDVETQVGRGSAFRVTLPPASLTLTLAPRAAAPEAAPLPCEPVVRPRRVLVVDDDALVARAVVRTLGKRYAVTTAASAAEALARIDRGEQFDAVLCDLMMPEMSGMELHARLAACDPGLARRMVFITGGAFTDAAARFLADGPAAFLEKPFEAGQLREAVERAAAA